MRAIHTPTHQDYKDLMRIFEDMGRMWVGGQKPTEYDCWSNYKKETCVDDEDNFGYSSIDYYQGEGYEIIEFKEYKKELKMYKQGDILDNGDHQMKILGVCGEVYFLSRADDFKVSSGIIYTQQDLDNDYYKLKSDEAGEAIATLERLGKIKNGKIIKG